MIRMLLLIALAVGLYYFIQWLLHAMSDTVRCSRCEGKGFWLAARGKEVCDWCKGSGRLPRHRR